jgi:hypothetical protein
LEDSCCKRSAKYALNSRARTRCLLELNYALTLQISLILVLILEIVTVGFITRILRLNLKLFSLDKQFGVEKPPALKLILKVGSSSTPEHSNDSPGPSMPVVHSNNYSVAPTTGDEESRHSAASFHGREESHMERQHKKAKKKKKKKEKDKDRDKHEKKHKHHHKVRQKEYGPYK